MSEQFYSKLTFKKYLVEKIHFSINNQFETSEKVELEFSLDSNFEIQDEQAIVILKCIVFPDAKKNNKPFKLEINLIGIFQFEAEFPEGEQKSLLEVNATAILFPYLRALVSNITSNSGFPPLILPTINVAKFIEKQKNDNS